MSTQKTVRYAKNSGDRVLSSAREFRKIIVHNSHIRDEGTIFDTQCGYCTKKLATPFKTVSHPKARDNVQGDRTDEEGTSPPSLDSQLADYWNRSVDVQDRGPEK